MDLNNSDLTIIQHLELTEGVPVMIEKINGDRFLCDDKVAYKSLIEDIEVVKILTNSGKLAVEKVNKSEMTKRILMQKTVNLLPQN